jgi:hypothetical protein
MALTPTFDATLSRVRLAGTALTGAATAKFERSANGIYWTTVRGGSAVPVSSNTANLDDYEFVPGATNYYRVTAGSNVFPANLVPAQTGVWFKSITRPFLNRSVKLTSHGDITRPARNGVFDIVGRSYPVAVTDLRLSRRWNMTVKCETVSDADALELVFASGDPIYIQTDGQYDIPGGYVVLGDVTRRRYGTVSQRRWFDMGVTEVAAPGPNVVGTTVTWDLLMAAYGSWNAILAAFGTWTAVNEYVASPDVVIVP